MKIFFDLLHAKPKASSNQFLSIQWPFPLKEEFYRNNWKKSLKVRTFINIVKSFFDILHRLCRLPKSLFLLLPYPLTIFSYHLAYDPKCFRLVPCMLWYFSASFMPSTNSQPRKNRALQKLCLHCLYFQFEKFRFSPFLFSSISYSIITQLLSAFKLYDHQTMFFCDFVT